SSRRSLRSSREVPTRPFHLAAVFEPRQVPRPLPERAAVRDARTRVQVGGPAEVPRIATPHPGQECERDTPADVPPGPPGRVEEAAGPVLVAVGVAEEGAAHPPAQPPAEQGADSG